MKEDGRNIGSVIWALLLIALVFAGCSHPSPPPHSLPTPAPEAESGSGTVGGNFPPAAEPMPAPASRPDRDSTTGSQPLPTVAYHVWSPLSSFGAEQKDLGGYAVYTYVLFNSNEANPQSTNGQRYESILKAILQDVKTDRQGEVAGWPGSETNVFYIPVVAPLDVAEPLANYNLDLSMRYLGILQKACRDNAKLFKALQQKPGPFLVSLYSPLPDLQRRPPTKILYADLSTIPPGAMREILDAYRQRLNADPLGNMEKLRLSMRLTLLKYILKVDENLRIVEVALADTL